MATPGPRRPLGHRDFAFYFAAQVTEGFALTMATVAIGWQVYSVRESPLDLALVALAEFLPLPLLALPAGHLADRFPRHRLWTSMLGLNTLVLGGLLAVTLSGADRVWPFFVLAFVQGVGSAMGAPASRALMPSLVPQDIRARLRRRHRALAAGGGTRPRGALGPVARRRRRRGAR